MPPFRLQRPDPSEYNPRFHSKITSVPDADDFASLICDQARATVEFMTREFGENHAGLRYGPDKWTAREVIGHLSDCERVFGYRAMGAARCRSARFCTSPPDTSCIICACSARDTYRPSAADSIAR
jgi:hypothetical protein